MKLPPYLDLTKPAVTFLLLLAGVAGGFLANPATNIDGFVISLIALYIATSGINAITNYIDRDIDGKMRRTCNRAIPSGRIKPNNALAFGTSLLIISISIAWLASPYSSFWIVFGVMFDPVLYNWLSKRRTAFNILIGSLAGGAPVFVMWSGITGKLFALTPFYLFMIIVIWTPIHIWSISIRYYDDYKAAGIPMLPVVYGKKLASRMIGAFSLLLTIFTTAIGIVEVNFYFLILIEALNIIMLILSFKTILSSSESDSFKVFIYTNIYLAIIFIIIILNRLL
ncbi:MAG: heme o synthase [Nitrososphaeria archaeon]